MYTCDVYLKGLIKVPLHLLVMFICNEGAICIYGLIGMLPGHAALPQGRIPAFYVSPFF